MTLIKICGITNIEDALAAVDLGADLLGFNFYKKSPRYIKPDDAAKIVAQTCERAKSIGIFVNEDLGDVVEIAEQVRLDGLQLHGEESGEYVAAARLRTGLEVIRAFRTGPEFDLEDVASSTADVVLLDSYLPFEYGGTGAAIDLETAKAVSGKVSRLYLAGGLRPDNVYRAIRKVDPFGVDVCSGVESSKGRKDLQKLKEFISEARR